MLDSLFHHLDVFFGMLPAAGWDAIRGWLTTLGGLVAVILALFTYMRNVRIKNEEQARKVYAESRDAFGSTKGASYQASRPIFLAHPEVGKWKWRGGEFHITTLVDHREFVITVKNMSDEIIGPGGIRSVHPYPGEPDKIMTATFEVIKPNGDETWVMAVPAQASKVSFSPSVTVIFRDSGGRWWSRTETDPIKHSQDPRKKSRRKPHLLRRLADRARARAKSQSAGKGEPSRKGPPPAGQ